MATAVECLGSDQKGVVLRVKRKRTDDAVEALVVSHVIPSKKAHISNEDKNDNTVTSEIFRLLGTCNEGDDSGSSELLKNASKSKPISHGDLKASKGRKDQTANKQKQRQTKKESHSDARFRIISSLRQEESISDSKPIKDESNPKLQRNISSDGSTDSADDEVKRLFTVYDIIRDEQDERRAKDVKTKDKTDETNRIMCNNVEMIREKLAVTEKVITPDTSDQNYVYDYYYTSKSEKELGDILEITSFDKDNFYLETIDREFEEMFEDDDDSNDENNWRNDYPDEDAWSSEEETKPQRMKMNKDFGFSYGMDGDDDDLKYDKRAFGDKLTSDDDDDDDDDDELNEYGRPYTLSSRKEVYREELSDDPDLADL